MSCETKSSQSFSSQIPIFGATGSGGNNSRVTLPSFEKAAHTTSVMNSIPPQSNHQNYRPLLSENYLVENKVSLTPMQRQENSLTLRGPIEIDLTGEKAQQPTRNMINHRQVQNDFLNSNYSNGQAGSSHNEQVLKRLIKDPTQTRLSQDPQKIVNGQIYTPSIMQNNQYPHANLHPNQQMLLETALNTPPKISPENILKNSQNCIRKQQITNVPYRSNEPLQLQRDRYVQTREPQLASIHTGNTMLKNQNIIPPGYMMPQQNSLQLNAYGKETNILSQPHMSSESSMQNNTLQSKYNPSPKHYQAKPREFMDPKGERVINGRQILPNTIHQQVSHGRSAVSREPTPVIRPEYLAAQLANHGVSQSEHINKMNGIHGETQTQNFTHKVNPMFNSIPKYQNHSAHDQYTAPKPMTTPRATIIPEESTPWLGVPHFYEYTSSETVTEHQLQEDIINSVEEATRVSKYSQYPEAKKAIELIKDHLMIDTYPDGYSAYPYAQQEIPGMVRKRPNEMTQNQPLKKQILSTQNPYLTFHEPFTSIESPPNASLQYYSDNSTYDVSQSAVQHQTSKYAPHQSSYNFNNNEMNQIVPTSNSVHSSPSSNRNHDSPGTDLVGMKRREDELDRYYNN